MLENETDTLNGDDRERRAEKRLLINSQVEISGIDREGNSFTGLAKVRNFNEVGCNFQTKTALQCGDTIAIKLLAADGECLPLEPARMFEVMWTVRSATGWMVGAQIPTRGAGPHRESHSSGTALKDGTK